MSRISQKILNENDESINNDKDSQIFNKIQSHVSLKRNKSASSIMSSSKILSKSKDLIVNKERTRGNSKSKKKLELKLRNKSLKTSMSSSAIKNIISEKEFKRPPQLKKLKKKKNIKFHK
jgi:hypothetical protein